MLERYCRLSVEKLLVVIPDPFATSFPQPAALLPLLEQSSPKLSEDDDDVFIYPGSDSEKTLNDTPGPSALFVQPEITYWAHEREMNLYLTLVSRVDPNHNEDAFSTGYDHYLRDALLNIERQQCSQFDIDLKEREKMKHRLNPTDPMLASLLESFRRFFCNTPEQNMALTGVLATLAICPDRSLAGWLTFAIQGDKAPSDLELYASLGRKDDGDDRSIDWRIPEELSMKSQPLSTSAAVDDRTKPVVYTILHGLVGQLERYRQLVDDFDRFLLERRQGLLFSENLTDALTLALEFEGTAFGAARVVSPVSTPPLLPETPRPKPKAKAASLVSFLTPRKKTPKQSVSDVPALRGQRGPEASPFAPHYQRTASIVVEPYLAPAPEDGPWMPAKPKKWNAEEAEAFASGQWGEAGSSAEQEETYEEEQTQPKITHVSLSQLLDNVVILEECMKELVAIIHARRSLGIDSIRYL